MVLLDIHVPKACVSHQNVTNSSWSSSEDVECQRRSTCLSIAVLKCTDLVFCDKDHHYHWNVFLKNLQFVDAPSLVIAMTLNPSSLRRSMPSNVIKKRGDTVRLASFPDPPPPVLF